MKKDIETRADIETLVRDFYEKVKADTVIGCIFTEVAHVNWETHLPLMVDFWENTLFYTGSYTGNPMKSHLALHHIFPLTNEHFAQWNLLFSETVDDLFEGDRAALARQRALSISTVIRIKLAGN